MANLYPIPADNGKLMFRIYSSVLYLLVGLLIGTFASALNLVGFVMAPVLVVTGFFLSRFTRKLEMKAERHAGNYGIRNRL